MVQRLARHWRDTAPDMVVSLIPNFNRALHDSLALARPGVPFVTVLTDMADHPPNFWIEPATAQHLICGTGHAVSQALAAGCAPGRVHRASGMILRPDFHAAPAFDRGAERARLGLDPHTPTGLVLFGGTGSRVMKRITQRLPHTPLAHGVDLRPPPGHTRAARRGACWTSCAPCGFPCTDCRDAVPGGRHHRRLAAAPQLVLAAGPQRRGAEAAAQGAQGHARDLRAGQPRRVCAQVPGPQLRRRGRGARRMHTPPTAAACG
jgi:hypothetical protein